MPALPPDKRTRLVRLCGMLGSDFDGERANAARLANTLIQELRLTWDEVIAREAASSGEDDRASARGAYGRTHGAGSSRDRDGRARWDGMAVAEVAEFCLRRPALWTEWERTFLGDMRFRVSLSEKQEAVLRKLYEKAKLRGGPL